MDQAEQSRLLGLLEKKMPHLISKCWADEAFRRQLLADPTGTLKAQGVEIPAGMTINALENTDKVFHLVIPVTPADDDWQGDSDHTGF